MNFSNVILHAAAGSAHHLALSVIDAAISSANSGRYGGYGKGLFYSSSARVADSASQAISVWSLPAASTVLAVARAAKQYLGKLFGFAERRRLTPSAILQSSKPCQVMTDAAEGSSQGGAATAAGSASSSPASRLKSMAEDLDTLFLPAILGIAKSVTTLALLAKHLNNEMKKVDPILPTDQSASLRASIGKSLEQVQELSRAAVAIVLPDLCLLLLMLLRSMRKALVRHTHDGSYVVIG